MCSLLEVEARNRFQKQMSQTRMHVRGTLASDWEAEMPTKGGEATSSSRLE